MATNNQFSKYGESNLPPNQKIIRTSGVRRLDAFMSLTTDPDRGYSTMGLVIGEAGIGKTVAIEAHLNGLEPRSYTSLPAVIKIRLKMRPTPKSIALNIATALRDQVKGRNIYQVVDEAAEAIIRNDLKCLIVDEADSLKEGGFEVLRYLFDSTGCPIVVVGLPSIERVINRHEKFKSRVGLRMEFMPVEEEEMLNLVLPNLTFPCWQFDYENEDDIAMGKCIYKRVGHSLRKLRNLLQTASQMAQSKSAPRVTLDMITEASGWSVPESQKSVEKRVPENALTKYEEISERRQRAKKR